MAQIFLSGEVFKSLDVNGRRFFCLSAEALSEAVGISKQRPIVIVALEADMTADEISALFNGGVKHILPLNEIAEPGT